MIIIKACKTSKKQPRRSTTARPGHWRRKKGRRSLKPAHSTGGRNRPSASGPEGATPDLAQQRLPRCRRRRSRSGSGSRASAGTALKEMNRGGAAAHRRDHNQERQEDVQRKRKRRAAGFPTAVLVASRPMLGGSLGRCACSGFGGRGALLGDSFGRCACWLGSGFRRFGG